MHLRILGIDPGSQFMGLGCVEKHGSQLLCVGHRLVHVKGKDDRSWAERLKIIFESVSEQIAEWKPACAAIENVFMSKNASSALKLGQARGAAIAAVAVHDLPMHEYSPREVKQSLTASGAADKDQVERMVQLLLGVSLREAGPLVRSDSADALAVAICHSQNIFSLKKEKAPLRISARDLHSLRSR